MVRIRARRVALQLQPRQQRSGGGVLAGHTHAGFLHLRQRRCSGGGLQVPQVQVVRQRGLRGAVLVGVGLDRADQARHIVRIHGIVADELGQVVPLVGHVDVEVEVLRVHAADAQVRDVAHHADGHGHVELRDLVRGRLGAIVRRCNAVDLRLARGPAPGVVVVGIQPLGARVLEGMDKGRSLCGRLGIALPGNLAVTVVVERVHRGRIVRVVGPAQHAQLLRCQHGLDIVRVVGGVGCGGGLAMAMASGGSQARKQECGGGGPAKTGTRTGDQSELPLRLEQGSSCARTFDSAHRFKVGCIRNEVPTPAGFSQAKAACSDRPG